MSHTVFVKYVRLKSFLVANENVVQVQLTSGAHFNLATSGREFTSYDTLMGRVVQHSRTSTLFSEDSPGIKDPRLIFQGTPQGALAPKLIDFGCIEAHCPTFQGGHYPRSWRRSLGMFRAGLLVVDLRTKEEKRLLN